MLYTLVCPLNCSFSLSNESTTTLLPFTSTSGDLDISLELSLRPLVNVNVDALDRLVADLIPDAKAGVTAYVDTPKLDLQVSTVHKVTASCDPASSSEVGEYVFPSLINIAPSWGIDAFFIAALGGDNVSFAPPSYTVHNFTNICMEFNSTTHALGPPSTKPGKSSAENLGNPVFGCLVAWVIAVLVVM